MSTWYFYSRVAMWSYDYVMYPIASRIYQAVFPTSTSVSKQQPSLSITEQQFIHRIQSGEVRLYEVMAPSSCDEDGVLTRYLILDNTTYKESETRSAVNTPTFL